ncbi:MAG TPA: hypothetical protein VEY09_09560 [Pyrinomonadaceae bacterium]|nr:hypothetical protein [Pyrinomonadaceae bacterium]
MRLPPPPQIGNLPTPALAEAVGRVFEDLTRIIGYLDVLRSPEGVDPSQAAHVFTTLQVETLMFVDTVEGQVLTDPTLPRPLHSALDTVCFAVRHETRRAFTDGADGLDSAGILLNCFQQSYLILARVFNPTLEEKDIFEGVQERREQSLVLWEDLVELLGAVREARRALTQPALAHLLALLEQFRAERMKLLRPGDWAAVETFADGLRACRSIGDAESQLHQLDCYVELLLSHVRMRAALADAAL